MIDTGSSEYLTLCMKNKRGKEALDFIKVYIKMHGVSPTYELIAKAVGLKSKSNAHRIVERLITAGLLEKKPNKFYSIKVTDKSVKGILSL